MKLILQIALGVFLGSLSSSLILEAWHRHQAELAQAEVNKILAEQEKIGQEQANLIHSILQQGQQKNPGAAITPPPGFIPDDAQIETPKP